MQSLEVSGAVQPIYGSLGVKRLSYFVWGYPDARDINIRAIPAMELTENL